MRKIVLGMIICLGLLLPTAAIAKSEFKNESNSIRFKQTGLIQDIENTIKNSFVYANLAYKDGVISGTINVPSGNKEYIGMYELTSTSQFDDLEGVKVNGYNGIVNGGEQHFELFILEEGNAVINIFELEDDGYRLHPFTIHLDGNVNVPFQVFIDRDRIDFENVPIVSNNRTLVEFRTIFENLGLTVNWNSSKNIVSGRNQDVRIQLQLGSRTAYINGKPTTLDVPPEVVNGRTTIPLRFVTEATDATLTWDKDTKQIDIYSKGFDSLVRY